MSLFLLMLLTSCGGYEAAQKAYNLGEYSKAAELFYSAQQKEENKSRRADECFLLGEYYRHLGMTSKAASAYNRAVRYKCDDDEALLRLAEVSRMLGRFDEADEALAKYKEKHKTDKRVIAGEESSVLGRESWAELSKKIDENVDSGYVISPFKEINSKYSDYCPVYVGDGYDVVYFSSMRQGKKKRKSNKITNQGYSTIYMSRIDGRGKWIAPQPIGEPFGDAHTDDGAAYVSPDGHTMVFTRCPLNDQQGSPAHAYEMKREGGRWSDPVRIVPGGDSTMMVAHPTLSLDGQILYFVSDIEEGSMGGLDIWKSLRNVDGSWGPASNMGAIINTAGDEMFPYVRQDGTLYFSSNGHKGYGGLDIYKAVVREDGLYEVMNMGMPINSAGDDFGITFVGTAEEGLLSSNRGNSRGYDNIYSFYLPPVILTIEGHVGKSGKMAFANTTPTTETEPQETPAPAEQVDKTATAKATASSKTNSKTSSKSKSSSSKNSSSSTKKTTASSSSTKTSSTTKSSSSKSSAKNKKETKFEPLPDAFVRIVGTDGTNIKLKPNDSGVVSFVAERDVRYIILAGAPGYANARTELSTEGLNKTQTIKFTSLLNKLN